MDTSKAAAALGRRGGKAGTGEAKRRGDADHYRAIRAKRPAPQVYESKGEWGGYTVREGLKGWIVEAWSAQSGERTGWRCVVSYAPPFERERRLDAAVNGYITEAEVTYAHARDAIRAGSRPGETPILGVRVLSRGHVVR